MLPNKSTHTSRRKPVNRSNKRRKKNKPLLFVLIIIVLILGACGGVWLGVRSFVVGSVDSFKMVLVPDGVESKLAQVIFLSYDSEKKSVTAISLPKELQLDIAGGYGKYRIQSLVPLLKLGSADGAKMRMIYSLVLGHVIDEVVGVQDEVLKDSSFAVKDITEVLKTSHSFTNSKIGFWKQEVALSDVPESLFFHTVLPETTSGEEVLKKLDSEYELLSCPVAVVNTTSTTGLARKYTQLLESSGVTVLRVTDAVKPVPKSRVLTTNELSQECQKTVSLLQRVLPQNSDVVIDSQATATQRTDVILEVGEDAALLF